MCDYKTFNGRRPITIGKKYAPATGIQDDFIKVLTNFVETKSVRYECFAKIWREKKMSLICAGRMTIREAMEVNAFHCLLPCFLFNSPACILSTVLLAYR